MFSLNRFREIIFDILSLIMLTPTYNSFSKLNEDMEKNDFLKITFGVQKESRVLDHCQWLIKYQVIFLVVSHLQHVREHYLKLLDHHSLEKPEYIYDLPICLFTSS